MADTFAGRRAASSGRAWVGLAMLAAVASLALPMADGALAGARAAARRAPTTRVGSRVRATADATIYWSPTAVRPRRALVEAGSVVALDPGPARTGAGCKSQWARVSGGGFLCLDDAAPTERPVRPVPALVDDLLPFVYVHRRETKAFSYAFLPGSGREAGKLFRRGQPLDGARYSRHAPSQLEGRDLERRPIRDLHLVPGWTVTADVPVYPEPSAGAKPTLRLARHTPLLVDRRPAAAGWRKVRDAGERRTLGFMKDDESLRHWVGAPPVDGLAEGETWLDIDVGQQMLAMRAQGKGPIYVTLVSTGLPERPSPLGVFRMQNKVAYRSMGNFPHSRDRYFVENIPWVMYFLPAYAIHGAYWHDEFGNRRSHGCINLAPRDARHIYGRVPPQQQPGFFKTFASERAPGAVVRLRDSSRQTVADRTEAHGRSSS